MAQVIRTLTSKGKKKVEIFVTNEELMKALRQQDNTFREVKPTCDEYCLTFEED